MADGDESDRLARILFNAFEKNTSGAIVKRWLKITVDKCVFTCERPLSEVPPPLAQFIVDSIHRSIYSSTFVGEFVPRFHKDEPTEEALCASSHVFSREKPPWRRGCNPLPFSSSFLFLLFPRAQTKTAYLRLPVPTRVNTFTPRPPNRPPLRLSSTRPPFFPFSHHSGGPFTGAARVAFEVRSRPKESVKD